MAEFEAEGNELQAAAAVVWAVLNGQEFMFVQ